MATIAGLNFFLNVQSLNLIEAKLYMNNHCMVADKMFIMGQSEIQDVQHHRTNLIWEPKGNHF